MNSWKEAKKIYHQIEIPSQLTQTVEEALSHAADSLHNQKRRHKWTRGTIYTLAGLCAAFIFCVNVNSAFANTLYDIPIVGNIARVFTFREFQEKDDFKYIDVKMPALEHTGKTNLESRINYEIRYQIDRIIKEVEVRAKEYYDAFIATGGKKSEFIPIEVFVDYHVTCSNADLVSFYITKSESFASAYTEQFFFNVDLNSGKDLTLQDLLGSDYEKIANEEILRQMKQRHQEDPSIIYWGQDGDTEKNIPGFEGISEDQNFYINEKGNVVIIFEKYSIGPGSIGIQEFEIPTDYGN